MSDKEININIKTAVDASGANQAAEAMNKVKEAAEAVGESTDAVQTATDAEQENTQATEKNTKAKETSTGTKKKRKKATDDETKAATDNKQATDAAAQAVDKDTKERQENTKAVEQQGNAIDQTGQKGEQAGKKIAAGSCQGTAAVKNMGGGALQAAYFFDDLQYGIKGVMNNIPSLVMGFGGSMGLAGALSIATLAGAKLYDWLGASADKSDELAKKQKQANKELAEFLRDAERSRIDFVQKSKNDDAANAINEEYKQYVKNITYEYQQQTKEIEYQLTLRKMEIAQRLGSDTRKNKLQRLDVEDQYESGKITKHERDYRILVLDQNLDALTESARLKTTHEESLAIADKQGDTEGKRDISLGEGRRLQDVKATLPGLDEMSGLFRDKSRMQRVLQSGNRQISELDQQISSLKKMIEEIPEFMPEPKLMKGQLEELKSNRDKVYKAWAKSKEATINSINNRISKVQERLGEENIPFQPSYGLDSNGKPITDEQRTKEYEASLGEIDARRKAALEEAGKYQEELNGILKQRTIIEKEILGLEAESKENEQIRNKIESVGKKTWQKGEKKDQEKAEKALEKERAREETKFIKDEDKEAKNIQETMLKASVPKATQTSELKSQTKAWAETIKILTASLKDDGKIDDSELSAALRELAYSMKENGNQDNQTFKTLAAQIKNLTRDVNIIQRQRRNAS